MSKAPESWAGALFRKGKKMVGNNNQLINYAHCKEFALRWGKENRKGWNPQRVSKKFLESLNTKVRLLIQHSVSHHRSCGKTIMDFLP